MTTKNNDRAMTTEERIDQVVEEFGPIETLRDLVEFAGRLAAQIPEEQRKAERAVMVAYLDEVAAREPTRRPDNTAE